MYSINILISGQCIEPINLEEVFIYVKYLTKYNIHFNIWYISFIDTLSYNYLCSNITLNQLNYV